MNIQQLKEQGNQYYKQKKYKTAIEMYNECLVNHIIYVRSTQISIFQSIDPQNSVILANKSRAYKQLHQYLNAFEMIQQSITIDQKNVKNLLLLIQIVANMVLDNDEYDKHNKYLQIIQDNRLHIQKLIDSDTQNDIYKETFEEISQKIDQFIIYKQKAIKNNIINTICHYLKDKPNNQPALDYLNQISYKINKNTEIPEYLCCQISLETLEEPVMTNSGISYEKRFLLDHFQKLGHFDPVTREPVSSDFLVQNKALQQVIKAYQKQNITNPQYF